MPSFLGGGEIGYSHFFSHGLSTSAFPKFIGSPSHLVQLTRVRLSGNFKTFINRSILKNFDIIFLKKNIKIY